MAKPLTASLASVYGSVAEDLKRRIGDAQAAQAGPPVATGIEPISDADRVRLWSERRPEATDEAMAQLAVQKYQEHKQAGLPDDQAIKATAEDLTHFRYGMRLKVYSYGQPDAASQVAEAKRVRRLAERESTPDPPPPPPTMPTGQLTNAATMGAAAPPDPFAGGTRGMSPPAPPGAPVMPGPPATVPPAPDAAY